MAFPPLIFCLKTHKSALFVWTGVSSRVVLSIYSPSLALFVYLIQILWLDSFKNEMNEGGCWFVMIKFFKQKYIEKGLTLKLGQSSDEAEMRGGGKVSAPKVHKISICLKSSQERRSRIYHHVRTLLKVLGQHCCCNCGECSKIKNRVWSDKCDSFMCCHGFSVNSLSQNFRAGNSNSGQTLLMFFHLFPVPDILKVLSYFLNANIGFRNHENATCPSFEKSNYFFRALYWTHCSRTNLRMPKICYLAYFYCLFCKRIKFRYLRVIFWCWHLYKPESPKVNIKFHFTLFEIWDCLNEIPLFWYFPSFSSSLHRALVTYCACLFVLILRALLQIPKPSQILMLKFKILYLGS